MGISTLDSAAGLAFILSSHVSGASGATMGRHCTYRAQCLEKSGQYWILFQPDGQPVYLQQATRRKKALMSYSAVRAVYYNNDLLGKNTTTGAVVVWVS